MSSRALTEAERASLNLILEDLRFLFDKEEIDSSDLNTVLNNLKSDEAKTYINNLFAGSKPETALRESFFTSDSTFAKFLYGYAESSPEVVENGFVDYLIKDELGHTVVLELKSLFYSQKERDKAGAIKVKKLKQQVLDWSKHKEQIKSYITKGDYVILTNLKEWFFFSRSLNPVELKPFFMISLHEFIVEYENYGKNFKEFCDRKEYQAVRYELDKEFLGSLDRWVKKLSAVEFKADEKRKLELIIGLINKFIFIQTLDDYGVIGFKWVQNNWQYYESQWVPKGRAVMLEEFLSAVNKWFFKYYDTELFREDILKHVEKEKENIELFYETLRDVLGVTYLQKPIGFKGIIQYNFRLIDEDVLGKAYEAFLAKVRKEEGIYYTPKYITQYIAENTVGRVLDELLAKIKEKLEREQFEDVKELVLRFTSIRALDPACGSGSFLIKAIRIVTNKYSELNQLIESAERNLRQRYSNYLGSLDVPREIRAKLEMFSEIRDIIGPRNKRELISRILVRHIHGVDLDKRALEVAKVNIWLEAIKLAPKEFRYDRLPPDTNYILPNLEMNLCNGDSLIGLPEELTIKYLHDKHRDALAKLSDLRVKYLENPVDPKLVEEIEGIKHEVKRKLNEEFMNYLKTKELPRDIFDKTKPFHWSLEFWHAFFDGVGTPLPRDEAGFDVVIGNPPYVDYRLVKPLTLHKFFKTIYESCIGNKEKYNLYVVFIEKAVKMLKSNGYFAYINPIQVLSTYMALPLRKLLLTKYTVREIVDLSIVRVFEEAATYPILLFVDKREPASNSKIRISYKTTEDEIIARNIKYSEVSQLDFAQREDKVILIDCRSEILKLIKQMDRNKKLYEIVELKWGTSQSGYGKKKITKDKYHKLPESERQRYIPLAQSGDVVRYIISWHGEYIQKSIYPQKQLELFKSPKVVISRQSLSIESGYDAEGLYALGKVAFTSSFKEETDPVFLLALLNSDLLDFYFKKVYETLHMAGGYIRYDIPYLYQLPMASLRDSNSEKLSKRIKTCTSQTTKLKQARDKFIGIWREWSIRLKTGESSLHQILTNDRELIRSGEFDKVWASKVAFYPNSENVILKKEFNKFKVRGDLEKPVLRIYGLLERNKEELIYEVEFSGRELMLHVYLCLLGALASRLKIKTLSELLTKTIVPVIKEVNISSNKLTPNIIKKVRDAFENWLRQNKIENVEADIVKIDNEIEDLEAEIDALVFKLYELEEDEIKVVFDSLKTPTIYQSKVFEFFRKL